MIYILVVPVHLIMGKLLIQVIIEDILLKNFLNPSDNAYFLTLRMPSQDNSLEIGRFGDQIIVAFQNAELVNDPIFSFDYNEGFWLPVQYENKLGKTVCSFLENGNRMAFPYALKLCMLFQVMFGRKIRNENWLENGVKVE